MHIFSIREMHFHLELELGYIFFLARSKQPVGEFLGGIMLVFDEDLCYV